MKSIFLKIDKSTLKKIMSNQGKREIHEILKTFLIQNFTIGEGEIEMAISSDCIHNNKTYLD